MRSVYPFRYEQFEERAGMTLETISPRQFATYMLLVETALPISVLAQKLGITRDGVMQRQRELFDVLGVSTRLELMAQYHYRERHGIRGIAEC